MTRPPTSCVLFTHNVTDEAIGYFRYANGWTASIVPYNNGLSCNCIAWPSHGMTPIPGKTEFYGANLDAAEVAAFLVTVSKKEPV